MPSPCIQKADRWEKSPSLDGGSSLQRKYYIYSNKRLVMNSVRFLLNRHKGGTILLLLLISFLIPHLLARTEEIKAINTPQLIEDFLQTHEPIIITSDNDFQRYNFTGKGTLDDPYKIEGLNITTSEKTAIHVSNTTKYFIIQNCYIKAKEYGIFLSKLKQKTAEIFNNSIISNGVVGLHIQYSLGVKIDLNYIAKNNIGILSFFGSQAIIKNNTIIQNTNEGIRLEFTDSSLLFYNLIENNGYYGIFVVQTSDYNQIHHNWFINNFIEFGSQAWDDGDSNMWYLVYTLEGNYWSNWNGTGPYYIAGKAKAVDRYPLNINGTRGHSTRVETETQVLGEHLGACLIYTTIFELITYNFSRKKIYNIKQEIPLRIKKKV